MNALIVSDLHIGSTCFAADKFVSFLEHAPDHAALVLNGDTVHNYGRMIMPKGHSEVLDLISDVSQCRQVIWVYGNHDHGFKPPRPANIEFKESFNIGTQLLVLHGDKLLPLGGVFRMISICVGPILACIHREHMSVRLAKAIPFFFRFLARRMMINAVAVAAKEGYQAVACGHIHTVADKMCRGTRYINTGTWTDSTASYLLVEEERMLLREVPPLLSGKPDSSYSLFVNS